MNTARKIRGSLDLVMAALLVLGYTLLISEQVGEGQFIADQHFTYLTNQISYLTIIVLTIGAASGWLRSRDSRWYTTIRGCFVIYGFIVALVYNGLLRAPDHFGFHNEITHVLVPMYLITDWFVRSNRPKIGWNTVWIGASYPIAWTLVILVRGQNIDWYPYFFLNPQEGLGWWGVMIYVAVITILFLAAAAMIVRINNSRSRR